MADSPDAIDCRKQAAAEAAVAEIRDGMIVGLGTGTTAAYAIAALARRIRDGLSVQAVATSERTSDTARRLGIAVIAMDEIDALDLAIDGVDEIDPSFRAIKGAGGAMLREKVVADAAARMIAIADASKAVERLGARPLPVEVLPMASAFVARRIAALGGKPRLRAGTDGPARSDQGNAILDCIFGAIAEPEALAAAIAAIPGALGHGLFLREIDALYLAGAHGVERRDRVPRPADG